MRVALVDHSGIADRPDSRNRFVLLGQRLERDGHTVLLVDGAPASEAAMPILTGLNRADAAAPLIEAHLLAHRLASWHPDLIIAPLRGGILQGVLMARACGEAFAETHIAVWRDTPSRGHFLRGDDLPHGLAPLIADALEREVAKLADAILLPPGSSWEAPSGWPQQVTVLPCADLPASPEIGSPAAVAGGEIREIVFAAPLRRDRGLVEFITAMERLAARGLLTDRTVTLLGSARPAAPGIGQDWLSRRAPFWRFRFQVLDSLDAAEKQQYLANVQRIAVVIAQDADELLEVRRCSRAHIALFWGSDGAAELTQRIEQAVSDALSHPQPNAQSPPPTDWMSSIEKIMALPLPPPGSETASSGVTVCVLHHNRLDYLAGALASIPNRIDGKPVELLIIDNASDIPHIEEKIREIAGPRDHLRILVLAQPVPQASALNRGASEARNGIVLFLDDDNTFTESGVERLARAVSGIGFDIVVTALDLFDEGTRSTETVARLVFLGAAHSAGLFFNGFGDTAMAVRRDRFLAVGGFQDPGYSYPSLDWVFLARAQANGLRIGALQWPAVRYRRDTASADRAANKIDQEGARRFVFEAYGGTFDGTLVARYAQKLQLEEF